MVQIENPEWAWLFFGLIPLLLFLFWEARRKATLVLLVGELVDQAFVRRAITRALLLTMLFSLLFLSLMNPQLIREKRYMQPNSNSQTVALFDVSRSMAARPNPGLPDRLTRSKQLFLELLPQLSGSEVAVFAFTDVVLSHVSFTTNYELVRETIQQAVAIESTPLPGSDLVEALERISRKFDSAKDQKFLVIFTDGVMTGRRDVLENIFQEAREANIVLVIVGVGEKEGAPIPIFDESGRFTGFYALSKETGKPYVSFLDEENLRRLAQAGGGAYFFEKEGSNIGEFFSSKLTATERESAIAVKELFDLYPFLAAAAFVHFIVLLKRYQ